MNIANRFPAASLLVLLPLTAPALEKDLLIVNVEAIKQAAVNAVLDAYPDVFEDDLLVDAPEHNLTLICLPERFLQDATSVDQHARQCNAHFQFLLRESIALKQFVDDHGNCYEQRTASGFAVTVYADGSTGIGEVLGTGGSTTSIDCERLLNSATVTTEVSIHRPAPLEVVPGIAEMPPGPGLFYIAVAGIKEAAARAAEEAYPEYADGGLLPDDPDKPMLVPCHSVVEPSGEAAVAGMHLCFAHVEFRIADSVESATFLADDGTCYVASKYLGVKVAVGEDGPTVVGRPTFGCGGSGGDIECNPGPDTQPERAAYDDWCQPGERQAQ
jgi:hypothetical protein